MPQGLVAHERAVRRDLELLGLPARSWTATIDGPDGRPVLDVVVVGAGMYGIAAAAALWLRGLDNIVVLDRAEQGREGPWLTTARMAMLRSPKSLPGVDLGIPSLTFRAWYTARDGEDAWDALGKISNADWMAYLTWVRQVIGLPVRNNTEVSAIRSGDGHLEVVLGDGVVLHARRVVLATGRLGVGGTHVPAGIDRGLWPDRAAHAAEAIEFDRLAGCRVAVLGGGPSAWDNAATALEHGAASVDLYVRREVLPQVNKFRASATAGFFDGWAALPLAERWRLICFLDDHDTPPPHESVLRALARPGFAAHLGTPVLSARRDGDAVELVLGPDGRTASADFLVVATGYAIDLAQVPELAELAPYAATWADAYEPPPGLERPERAAFPFLGDGFELTERVPGGCPALGRVHLFNHGAFASLGAIASDIPGVSSGAGRLATRIAQSFFAEDLGHVLKVLAAFDEPELESTPFYSAEQVQAQRSL